MVRGTAARVGCAQGGTVLPDTPGDSPVRGDAHAVLDGGGTVVSWSPGAQRMLGRTAAEVVGTPGAGLLHSGADGARILERRTADRSVALGVTGLRHLDGRRVDVVLWAHPLVLAGRRYWLLQAEDAEAVRRSELRHALLQGVFTESPFIIDVFDRDLRFLAQNDSQSRAPGFTDVVGRTMREAAPPGLLDVDALEHRQRQVLATGKALIGTEVRGRDPRDPDRDTVWEETILPLRGAAGDVVALAHMVTDTTEESRARERLDLVNEASARIGSRLEVLTTAQELTDVAVPRFADLAYVNLLDPVIGGAEPVTGPLREAVVLRRAASTMDVADLRKSIVATGDVDVLASAPDSYTRRALADGEPVRLTGDQVRAALAASDPARGALAARYGIHSWLLVPMFARGAPLGSAVFVRITRAHPFEDDDVPLAREMVTRAAVCIDNASRYTRERTTALTLQRNLLPRSLPELRGVESVSRCLPSGDRAVLGGGWFDVIPLSGARVAMVIGDAGDDGLYAAVSMGRLRTAVRTLADLDLSPDELLTHLDDQVKRTLNDRPAPPEHPESVARSCLFAVFDPISRKCRFASAGHPPPVRVGATGQPSFVDVPVGAPLGIGAVPYESGEVTLADGDVLVLSTGSLLGVPGARDRDAGPARLREALSDPGIVAALRSGGHDALGDAGDAVLRRLHPGIPGSPGSPEPNDVLLLARVHGLAPDRHVTWDLPAEPEAVGRARALTVGTLAEWGLEELEFTTELLVSELVTNAIRYGRPPLRLRLIHERTLILEVSDGSNTSPHARRALETDEGGRGLFLVAQVAKLWGTRYEERGKTIWAEQPLTDGTDDTAL
ncbi:SpoIIE family protein phosphatase [Streptomyces sp. MI02-7b]|uniref:SpoIIE family protein phosphatase n=1 Tax=Streptomyces sp. MI02-7b TaxID=462941 RepID=UPI0029B64D42|nr:SpoIIE family protein phosphatase [Streptomyces sp. MI02-7b]MDX3072930.1 SpoIIE family protein phosphatase [Streptomyces sp. MI02-7b]